MSKKVTIKKLLGKVALYSSISISLLLTLYLIVVYANDSRIDQPKVDSLTPATRSLSRVSSMFENRWPVNMDMDWSKHHKMRTNLAEKFPNHLTVDSVRFPNKWQSFVNLGSYPQRISGRNTLMIPAGHSVTIELPSALTKTSHFGSFEFGGIGSTAQLNISSGSTPVTNLTIKDMSWPRNEGDRWRHYLGRYLSPDEKPPGGDWQTFSFDTANFDKPLVASCQSANSNAWCLISDIDIYAQQPSSKQNIVFILVDTLRYDGINQQSMPRLSSRSDFTRFTHAIAPGNMTGPSTNSILSCQSPSHLGDIAFSYATSRTSAENHYANNQPSIAYYFSKHGWKTAQIGNISIISDTLGMGVDHGFRDQIAIETPGYDTARIAKEAVQWLQRNHDRPFYLYIHFHGPHAPYRPPLRDMAAVYPGSAIWPNISSVMRWLYSAEVHQTDRYLDKVLLAIDALDLDKNTTVLISADHGDHHEVRTFSENEAGPAYTGTFFDHGATLYNDEIRVPILLRTPNKRASTVNDWVSGYDIGPTLLDLSGLASPQWCSGRSLVSYLNEPDAKLSPFRVLTSEGFKRRSILWKGRYKYIRSYAPTEKKLYSKTGWKNPRTQLFVGEQLYDLSKDPKEQTNIIDNKKLRQAIHQVFRSTYGIKEGIELVITNPNNQHITVQLDTSSVSNPDILKNATLEGNRVTFVFTDQHRIIALDAPPQNLVIRADEKDILVKATSLALPLAQLSISHFPLEIANRRGSSGDPSGPSALIRRTEIGDSPSRQLITGDPKFQKILREWGYLNDQR